MNRSNVIDIPRPAGAEDLLGVDRYVEALVRFISTAQMPTTLAIQGEWGSGKTSLMNQVRYSLCEMPDKPDLQKPFYGVWINTWQYSLMKSPDEALLSVIQGITAEVSDIMQQRHHSQVDATIKKIRGLLGKIARVGAKAAVTTVGVDTAIVDDLLSSDERKTSVAIFRQALTDAIRQCLEEDRKAGNLNRGFLFFIDDLDRLDPVVAVQVLELLKNLFEVENCIFILAIDYEVVVKGLVPKFGPLTEKNEREFRSFFDKIIQLPFSMPVASYRIDTYLNKALVDIGYYSLAELEADSPNGGSLLSSLSDLVQLSTGTNPRSVKRLINTLSLIQIMYLAEPQGDGLSAGDKLLGFGLVCVQIAYPVVYEMLLYEPDFKAWDDKVAKRFHAQMLNDHVGEQLYETEEFDEEWEQTLYRVCQNNTWLASRAFSVSRLLNLISAILPAGKSLGDEVEKMLGVAAITTVTNPGSGGNVHKGYERIRLNSMDSFYESLTTQHMPAPMIQLAKAILDKVQGTFGEAIRMEITPKAVSVVVVNNKSRERKLLFVQPRKRDVLLHSSALGGYKSCKVLESDVESGVPADLLPQLKELFMNISTDKLFS